MRPGKMVGAPPDVLIRADEEFTKRQNGDCHYEGQRGRCAGTEDRRDAEKRPGNVQRSNGGPIAAGEVFACAVVESPRSGIMRRGGNNDRLSTLWPEVISLAGLATSFLPGGRTNRSYS